MSGVISTSFPSGRLGNQLFQLNFVSQLAREFDFEMIHPTYSELKFIPGGARKITLSVNALRIPEVYSSEKVRATGWKNFENQLRAISKRNGHVHLRPGFLGEFFRESSYRSWEEVLNIPFQGANRGSEIKNVALHFRGTDFATWDPQSILGSKYYLDSIKLILETVSFKEMKFLLVTDDVNHENVRELVSKTPVPLEIINSDANSDFKTLLNADVIVHSASTFSFWAAMLGATTMNVYPKSWIEYKLSTKDKFWSDYYYHGFRGKKIETLV